MKRTLPSRLLVLLSVGGLAVWIASSHDHESEPARLVPAVASPSSDSAYPAPQVDASAPPPEPAPTF